VEEQTWEANLGTNRSLFIRLNDGEKVMIMESGPSSPFGKAYNPGQGAFLGEKITVKLNNLRVSAGRRHERLQRRKISSSSSMTGERVAEGILK